MRKNSALGAIVTALVTAACNHAGAAEEAGPSVSRDFTVGSFDHIEVSGPYDVEVRTGGNPSVSAKGPQNLVERMDVRVQDGRLLIRPRKDEGRFQWGSRGHVEVQVTAEALRGAEITGAGDIRIDRVQGQDFKAGIRGSGDLSIAAMEAGAFAASIAGSGDIRASSGQADQLDLKIGGSGNIDTQGVTAKTASATISGSGNIAATATDTAAVRIYGAGDVEIKGGAKCTVDNKGAGRFRCS